jgi:hypothetical protein
MKSNETNPEAPSSECGERWSGACFSCGRNWQLSGVTFVTLNGRNGRKAVGAPDSEAMLFQCTGEAHMSAMGILQAGRQAVDVSGSYPDA